MQTPLSRPKYLVSLARLVGNLGKLSRRKGRGSSLPNLPPVDGRKRDSEPLGGPGARLTKWEGGRSRRHPGSSQLMNA